jgi:hypothetical protein
MHMNKIFVLRNAAYWVVCNTEQLLLDFIDYFFWTPCGGIFGG